MKKIKIYTGRGDRGETSLFGGEKTMKYSERISACGSIDELNGALGVAVSFCGDSSLSNEIMEIQRELFIVGGDLAAPLDAKGGGIVRVEDRNIARLEREIDRYDERLDALQSFVLPGGSKCAAQLHLSRAICRRAERIAFAAAEKEAFNDKLLVYLNRLSDLLFMLARYANKIEGIIDIPRNDDKCK